MKFITEPVKNWFGFSRRERRSTFSLLLLLVLIIGVRYSFPDSRITINDITGNGNLSENLSELSFTEYPSSGRTYSRDSGRQFKDTTGRSASVGRRSKYGSTSSANKTVFRQSYKGKQYPLMEINSSDSATLVRLPGIGPVLSARIIKYRKFLGGFAVKEQLKEVYGLTEETYDLIKGRIFADSSVIERVSINSAGFKELSHLRYLEKYEITAILKYRELKGKIKNIGDLTENKLITVEKAAKVRTYIKFED